MQEGWLRCKQIYKNILLHTDTQSGKETRPRGGDDTGKETEK